MLKMLKKNSSSTKSRIRLLFASLGELKFTRPLNPILSPDKGVWITLEHLSSENVKCSPKPKPCGKIIGLRPPQACQGVSAQFG